MLISELPWLKWTNFMKCFPLIKVSCVETFEETLCISSKTSIGSFTRWFPDSLKGQRRHRLHWFSTFQMWSFLSISTSYLVLYLMNSRPRKWRSNHCKVQHPCFWWIGTLFVIKSGLCGAPLVISDSLKFHTKSEARLTMVVAIR